MSSVPHQLAKGILEERKTSVPSQLLEVRCLIEALTRRVDKLELENASFREAFSRGNLPSPKTAHTGN